MPDDDRDRSLESLLAENTVLRQEIKTLREDNGALAGQVGRLTPKVAELETRLGKSSQNSSLPPSSDAPGKRAEATKTRAERRAEAKRARRQEGRRRGKQVGAPGRNLPPSDDPDEVVIHEPEQCSSCGDDLSGASEEGFERRQVFDAPQPTLICTEHRAVPLREGDDRRVPARGQGADVLRPERARSRALLAARTAPARRADRRRDLGEVRRRCLDWLGRLARRRGGTLVDRVHRRAADKAPCRRGRPKGHQSGQAMQMGIVCQMFSIVPDEAVMDHR